MFDVNRDKVDGSGVPNDLGGEFLELLIFIGDHLGFCKVFHWLRDEAPRNATIRELSLRSDRYLEDIGASARRCNQTARSCICRGGGRSRWSCGAGNHARPSHGGRCPSGSPRRSQRSSTERELTPFTKIARLGGLRYPQTGKRDHTHHQRQAQHRGRHRM